MIYDAIIQSPWIERQSHIFNSVMQQISGQSLVSDVADLGSKLSKRVERVNFEYNTLLFN